MKELNKDLLANNTDKYFCFNIKGGDMKRMVLKLSEDRLE